jgi:hypothetical protein
VRLTIFLLCQGNITFSDFGEYRFRLINESYCLARTIGLRGATNFDTGSVGVFLRQQKSDEQSGNQRKGNGAENNRAVLAEFQSQVDKVNAVFFMPLLCRKGKGGRRWD